MADDKDQKNKGGQGGDDNGADKGKDGEGKEIMIPKARFDEVNDQLKELKTWKETQEKEKAEAEKKRLEEQGKYKELAEKEKAKREEYEKKYARNAKMNALKLEAIKAGTVDADAVVALANLDEVTLSEDGSVDSTSVTSIIEKMKAGKKYLFGAGNGGDDKKNIGADGGAPDGGSNTTPTFKRSQLLDPKFYKENRDKILQAQREGKIVDDVNPQPPTK